MKVIHFVIDDKFIDGAITLFESDERVENHYVIFQYRYPVNPMSVKHGLHFVIIGNIAKPSVKFDKKYDINPVGFDIYQ